MIHPTAIIHPRAKVHPGVWVGPYAIVDDEVEVGPDCHIGPYVHLTGRTRIGPRNRFYSGAVIGEAPQDLKYKGAPTGLVVGEDNIFREHVTVHRSTLETEVTRIGSGNFFMAHSHVAHNCRIGNQVIVANGALFGGHVSVDDRAFISGNCVVHQFVRIGTLALMQGGSGISKDLPPYTVARGDNGICGLNIVGLRRAGVPAEERLELKELYHELFRGGVSLRPAVAAAASRFTSRTAVVLLEFLRTTKRGVCADAGLSGETAGEDDAES